MKRILATLLLLLSSVALVNAQTADEIADSYVKAIGGAAKLQSLKSRKVDITMSTSGIELPGVIYEDDQNRQKLELTYMGMKIINSYDGKVAWAQNPSAGMPQPTKLSGEQAEAMKPSEFLNEFVNHKSRGMKLELKPEEELGGKSYFRIDLTTPEGKLTKYFFDKETYLIAAKKEMAPGIPQEVTTYFSEYKEFGGMKMPTQISAKVGGVEIQGVKVNGVELNVEIPDSVYAFPGN